MSDSGKIKKINTKISKIKDIVKKQGGFAYYLVDGDEIKLVNKDHTEDLAKKKFTNRIQDKSKYIGDYVYEVSLMIDDKYVTHEHKLVAGPVSLKIKQYHITDDFDLKYKSGYKNGAIWYTNADLLEGSFHFTDIKKIIKIIHDNNVNIIRIGKVRAVNVLNKDFD